MAGNSPLATVKPMPMASEMARLEASTTGSTDFDMEQVLSEGVDHQW